MVNNLLRIGALFQNESGAPAPLQEEIEKSEKALAEFKGLSFDDAISKIANDLVSFSIKLAIAILVFYVGRFIIRRLYKVIKNLLTHKKVDPSLSTFVLSLFKMLVYFILIVTVIGILGIETSSFLAIFASAGVAIGMALSGTLQNFAGGVLILLLKPYKVGDYIEAQGYTGTVKAIQIFHTIINTVDNKAVIIPNGGLSTGTINNFSLEAYRRVDWNIGLAYGTDFDKAREAITDILLSDDRVVEKYIEDDKVKRLHEAAESDEDSSDNADAIIPEVGKDKKNWLKSFFGFGGKRNYSESEAGFGVVAGAVPVVLEKKDCSPFVGLDELADSSVNFVIRAWTHSSNYWPLYFEINRRLYMELPQKGFEFPFPQLDVHFDKTTEN